EDRLAREEVQLAEELSRAAADDLVAGAVEDRDLPLEDRDERIRRVADPEQRVAAARGPLLAHVGERRQLGGRERGVGGIRHAASLPPCRQSATGGSPKVQARRSSDRGCTASCPAANRSRTCRRGRT